MRKRGRLLAVVLLLFGSLFFLSNSAGAAAKLCVLNDDCAYTQYCGWFQCEDLWCAGKASLLCSSGGDAYCGTLSYGSYGNYCGLAVDTVPQDHKCVNIINVKECQSCQYPSADCNLNGGCETTLSSDVNNCGSCGKVCESGICNSGICAPKPDVCLEPGADADGDGYKATLYKGKSCGPDCDDNNALVHPGAVDVCCNGVDEDCSGGDAVCPKVCGNGIDENCNGKVD